MSFRISSRSRNSYAVRVMITPAAKMTKAYSASPDDFKDVNGRWLTAALFKETNKDESKYPSVFTLGDEDRDGRLSAKRIYMDANDPTEFLAAKHLFGSFDCWTNLCNSPFFKPHIKKWRTELHVRIRSRSVRVIEEAAETGDKTATQLGAAKWLATQEWDGNKMKAKQGPGRPKKVADPDERLREALDEISEDEEDLARLTS